MKERLEKPLTVKSIVTIALTALFIGVAAFGEIPQEVTTVYTTVIAVYTTVIAFYFETQATKE